MAAKKEQANTEGAAVETKTKVKEIETEKETEQVDREGNKEDDPKQQDGDQPGSEPKQASVIWLVNVKYRGNRYRKGQRTEVLTDDIPDLVAAKLAQVVE